MATSDYQKRWRAAHPESVKASAKKQAERYRSNPVLKERRNELTKRSYDRHREKRVTDAREWYRANRNRQIERIHGLPAGAYDVMRDNQENRCAICDQEDVKNLQVDHDHRTGKVRGLLCHKCNKAIGLLGDAPLALMRALGYLRYHKRMEAA
jgi:hypothetical protein